MARGGLDVTIIAISNRHLDIMPPRVSRSCPRNPVENDGNIARSQQSFQKNLARGDKSRTIIEIISGSIFFQSNSIRRDINIRLWNGNAPFVFLLMKLCNAESSRVEKINTNRTRSLSCISSPIEILQLWSTIFLHGRSSFLPFSSKLIHGCVDFSLSTQFNNWDRTSSSTR